MKDIKDNTLIIVPFYLKDSILLNLNHKLQNIKVMTLDSFIENFLFKFDEKTVYHMMSKYGLKCDLSLMYLKNLYFVENKNYNSSKLNKLVKLKNYLTRENLLIYNSNFRETLKRNNVIFYQIEQNKYNKNLIEQVKSITDVSVINNMGEENYTHQIFEFNDCNEELEFVAENICELINNGVNIKNIVLLDVNKDYLIPLKRIFKMFNININIPDKNVILSTKMVTFFLDNINSNINITFDLLKENFDLKNINNLNIYNKIINICNKYSWIGDYILVKDLLTYEFSCTRVDEEQIINAIRIEEFEQYQPNNQDYVFFIGFNEGIVPILERDEDYIEDSIKDEINVDTTLERNSFHNKKSLEVIKNTKNMWISYRKHGNSGELQLSSLNNTLNYEVIHSYRKYQYSNLNNLLTLGKDLDSYLTYGHNSEELINLYSNYPDIKYRSFDNKFKGINNEYPTLTLSYSSIDNYYKCAFRYYVSSVLKLNIYEENFANYLGSLFHFVLSKRNELALDESWNLFLQENPRDLTNKEQFFLNKGKEELKFILKSLEKQRDYTTFNDEIYETKIEIEKEGNVKFVGIIDKIMFNKEKDLASIVDYKTGNPSLNLSNIPYGLGLQLPIYLYLMNKSYKNLEVVGFYLQKILPSLIIKDQLKSLEDQKYELLKLQGYSLANESKLQQFDKTYVDSSYIKGMKVGNNGFYAYSKTLTKSEMNKITELVDKKIEEAIKNIKENNYSINPKHIGKENIGCMFCKFKDICYMNNKDVVYLPEIKDLDFLGGDDNA